VDRNDLLEGLDVSIKLFGTFFAFSNKLQVTGDAFYQEITCKQFFLILCLGLFHEQPPTIGELADVMGTSHQNVKQLVNKLEQMEFIQVYIDEKDKRKQRIVMTKKMLELWEKYGQKNQEFFDLFYQGVTVDELETTFNTLIKLEKNLNLFNIKKERKI
jgi:DNA-binding MarR family transcriptional regulator